VHGGAKGAFKTAGLAINTLKISKRRSCETNQKKDNNGYLRLQRIEFTAEQNRPQNLPIGGA